MQKGADKKSELAAEIFLFQEKFNPKEVKIHQEMHHGAVVLDCSVKSRGFDQDTVYMKTREFHRKIRRGNSFIKRGEEFVVLRRGLIKFFDMTKQQLQANTEFVKKYIADQENDIAQIHRRFCHQGKGQGGHIQNSMNNATFMFPLKCIAQGHPVSIFKLIKANGQNGQISYYYPMDKWVMCSKNVAILASDHKEIQSYSKEQRYGFASLIGHVWIDLVQKLGEEKRQQLKKQLSGHTLVCQYVGHQDHQHLVKYYKPSLLFYAMVSNDIKVEQSCIPPPKAYQFFNEYGLDVVELKHMGDYGNPVAFFQALDKIYMGVCSGDLDRQEEGSVLYFTGQDKTLSLAKLKTLEYRLWRKLREKIKHVTRDNAEKLSKEYMHGIATLVKQFAADLGRPLQFYQQIGEAALHLVAESKIENIKGIVAQTYIKFISIVLYCQCELNRHATDNDLRDEEMAKTAFERPWGSFIWPPAKKQAKKQA